MYVIIRASMKKEKLSEKLKRLSDELIEFIYPLTLDFPPEERYCLADQIRRSSLSVPSNIHEGLSRISDGDKRRFMILSQSSLSELKYQVYFARKRDYITIDTYRMFRKKSLRLSRLLGGFIKVLDS